MSDVYKKLALHLDGLPGGFPETENGVEIRILKRLFSPDEARIATALTMMPEPAAEIAKRVDTAPERLGPVLDKMSRKGLIFRLSKKGDTHFMAAQFVIGIWEYHVNDLDKGLIKDFNEYVPYLTREWAKHKTKQLRVVPVAKSLSADMEIMPYEAAEEIIRKQSKIVVSPCICRKEHAMAGKGCDNPLEVCLVFGSGAYYYEENELGRSITTEEALSVLQKGLDAGLVLQPGNSKKSMNICMCCGCCCQVLKNLKAFDEPAKAVNSNYYAAVDQAACIACGVCEDRCHMDAIRVDEYATIDLQRCIGCGVCVPSCDVQAITLMAKPKEHQTEPPSTVFETYFTIAQERGLFDTDQ